LERYLARVAFLAPNIKRVFSGLNSRKKRPKDTSEIVIHRQLQVSTGSGGALKPLFTGPYIVNSIDKDRSSASLEHLHTGRQISAHFTNIQIFHFDPSQTRLPQDFDDQIDKLFPEKY